MKRYKPKNQTYATAFKVLLSVNHHLIIEFKEGDRWHKVAKNHGVMHWFEEVDEFSNLPKSVNEIEGRRWHITPLGGIKHPFLRPDIDALSTRERAEAFLALMQLVELKDAWNGDWKPDFSGGNIYSISNYEGKVEVDSSYSIHSVLSFKSEELRDRFLEQFRDLIETAKELI